ncbi:PAS domain-containing protein [uncultured Sphingomonas sp.]|uniref:PAS domain-containing protein n=1 Tax=uncultured Sphingomonas sp. TaxID=158754 RepID=UPI0035CAEBF8
MDTSSGSTDSSSPADRTEQGDAGVAASLVSAVEWNGHPLGPRERWPTALKAMLAYVLASAEPMYLVWGADRSFFFNDAYAPILGPRLDTAMGARFDVLWADIYASVEPMFTAALAGRSSRVVDMPVPMTRGDDVEETWWTFSFSPVFADDGSVAGALCITGETTAIVRQAQARRHADAALDASERSLRRAQEAGQIGLFTVDLASDALSGTPEFFRLFGLPPAVTIAASLIETLVLPEDAAIVSSSATRASPDLDLHAEYRIRRPDTGEIRYIERRAEIEHDADGAPLRLVGVVQDVTDRRRNRDTLARLNASLEATVVERTQALLLHENIIQSDSTAICAFDTDYRLIAFNKAHNDEFFRVNGFYTKLGDVFHELFVPEQRDAMKAQMARALTGEAFTVEEEFGDPAIDAPRWEILYSSLRDPDGKIIGAFHHARDISARLRAQSELETARDALRQSQKMEAMGQLTGGVAHDFNNLLTPILGSLDRLRGNPGLSERELRLVEGALQSAERAKTLVHRLLAFARRQPLQSGAVDLADLLRGMSALVASTSGPQIRVVTELPDGLPPAMADANQLEMAVLNLCVNARDAMPDGGVITIAVQAEPARPEGATGDGPFLRLSVTDTGTGMDEETARRAVEPFYSTKGIGKGTGLGLSMVHGLVSQLGGSMLITSRPGAGARVDLLLPVSAEAVAAPVAAGAMQAPQLAGHVLVVDDERLVRMAIADMLENLGYRTTEVSDAGEAERLLANGERFDLVVTDHLMPGMSGAELASTIRQRWPRLPVLILSGYADVEGIPPDLPRLTKPFREPELAEAIARARRR